jgi:prepilin-type N-terminal cleavage/methylation domain-containing protein
MKRLIKGFTLIELMIVVAIIGVLAAIAIPQYSNFVSRSRAAAAVSELTVYRSAIAQCMQDFAGVPVGNCYTLGVNGIPAANAIGKNLTSVLVMAAATGTLTVSTGATDASGVSLTYINTPQPLVGLDTVLRFTNTGTLCSNPDRGLKSGQGDCP